MNNTSIFFDMDGTIADLYNVPQWLQNIENENTLPYEIANPLINLQQLSQALNQLQAIGYKINIISWLSKNGSSTYNSQVQQAKIEWLHQNLPTVYFNEIYIVEYGTNKNNFIHTANDILFDDELQNRQNWTGRAFNVDNILNILQELIVKK